MRYNALLHGTPQSWDNQRKHYTGGGGGGGQSTSTTTASIAPELKPLADLYVKQATAIGNTPFQPYGGQRFADLNQTQNLGLGMVQNRALGGSATMSNAENSLNKLIGGGNTNPYLDQMVNKAQTSVVDNFNNMVKPQTEMAMQNSGSFGNSGYQQLMQNQQKAAGQQMADIATDMYGNAYNTDQANRMQAIGMAPTFGNAAYQDAAQLLNAGGIQQNQAQQGLDFNYQQFQEAQNNPYKQLAATGGVVGQNMGSTTTGTQSGGGGK
jgi:hypothetical protein